MPYSQLMQVGNQVFFLTLNLVFQVQPLEVTTVAKAVGYFLIIMLCAHRSTNVYTNKSIRYTQNGLNLAFLT